MILGSSEVEKVIQHYFSKCKGENCYKLHSRIHNSFAEASKHVIQEWINSNRKHCESHPIFENKDPLQPIIAMSHMDVCQIDLVIMEKRLSKGFNNKTYFYILNIMDIFSRYIFLKPLQSKESLEVASHLREILFNVKIPNVIQCDHGTEFKGRNFQISCYLYYISF